MDIETFGITAVELESKWHLTKKGVSNLSRDQNIIAIGSILKMFWSLDKLDHLLSSSTAVSVFSTICRPYE